MGLSENKRKSKIPHDPNNHHWSRNTDRFGHKLLVAQGWTPGQKLGAVDASHAEHYTKGSESHIRVTLKEDNRGLGHKLYGPGTGETAETFGLTMFDGLLDRLNGKSKAEVKKAKVQADAKTLKMYHARRWGHVTFIKGGFLEREELVQSDQQADRNPSDDSSTPEFNELSEKKPSKRKRSASIEIDTVKASKRSKRSIEETGQRKKNRKTDKSEDRVSMVDKAPKRKRKERDSSSEMRPEKIEEKRTKEEKRQRKEEKKQRKEERRQKKEAKRAKKAAKQLKKEMRKAESAVEASSSQPEVKAVKLRNMARHKYIQQKRLASLNPQALNEIFMIKSSA